MMIYILLVAHWISDFILQSDSMAKNKSTSFVWLTSHCLVYTLSLMCIVYPFHQNFRAVFLFSLLNGIAHFCTDAITSRITSRLWKEGRVHDFFVVIGFDQLCHYVVLFTLAEVLL